MSQQNTIGAQQLGHQNMQPRPNGPRLSTNSVELPGIRSQNPNPNQLLRRGWNPPHAVPGFPQMRIAPPPAYSQPSHMPHAAHPPMNAPPPPPQSSMTLGDLVRNPRNPIPGTLSPQQLEFHTLLSRAQQLIYRGSPGVVHPTTVVYLILYSGLFRELQRHPVFPHYREALYGTLPRNPMEIFWHHHRRDEFRHFLKQATVWVQKRGVQNVKDFCMFIDSAETMNLHGHCLFPLLCHAFEAKIPGQREQVDELFLEVMRDNLVRHPKYEEFRMVEREAMKNLKKKSPRMNDEQLFHTLLWMDDEAGREFQRHEVFPFYKSVSIEAKIQDQRGQRNCPNLMALLRDDQPGTSTSTSSAGAGAAEAGATEAGAAGPGVTVREERKPDVQEQEARTAPLPSPSENIPPGQATVEAPKKEESVEPKIEFLMDAKKTEEVSIFDYSPLTPPILSLTPELELPTSSESIGEEIQNIEMDQDPEPEPENPFKEYREFQDSTLGNLKDLKVQKTILDVIGENQSIWKAKDFMDSGENWEAVGMEVWKRTQRIVSVPQLRLFWKLSAKNLAQFLRECICDNHLDEKATDRQLELSTLYPHIRFYRKELVEYERELRNEIEGKLVETNILRRIQDEWICLRDYGLADVSINDLEAIAVFQFMILIDDDVMEIEECPASGGLRSEANPSMMRRKTGRGPSTSSEETSSPRKRRRAADSHSPALLKSH